MVPLTLQSREGGATGEWKGDKSRHIAGNTALSGNTGVERKMVQQCETLGCPLDFKMLNRKILSDSSVTGSKIPCGKAVTSSKVDDLNTSAEEESTLQTDYQNTEIEFTAAPDKKLSASEDKKDNEKLTTSESTNSCLPGSAPHVTKISKADYMNAPLSVRYLMDQRIKEGTLRVTVGNGCLILDDRVGVHKEIVNVMLRRGVKIELPSKTEWSTGSFASGQQVAAAATSSKPMARNILQSFSQRMGTSDVETIWLDKFNVTLPGTNGASCPPGGHVLTHGVKSELAFLLSNVEGFVLSTHWDRKAIGLPRDTEAIDLSIKVTDNRDITFREMRGNNEKRDIASILQSYEFTYDVCQIVASSTSFVRMFRTTDLHQIFLLCVTYMLDRQYVLDHEIPGVHPVGVPAELPPNFLVARDVKADEISKSKSTYQSPGVKLLYPASQLMILLGNGPELALIPILAAFYGKGPAGRDCGLVYEVDDNRGQYQRRTNALNFERHELGVCIGSYYTKWADVHKEFNNRHLSKKYPLEILQGCFSLAEQYGVQQQLSWALCRAIVLSGGRYEWCGDMTDPRAQGPKYIATTCFHEYGVVPVNPPCLPPLYIPAGSLHKFGETTSSTTAAAGAAGEKHTIDNEFLRRLTYLNDHELTLSQLFFTASGATHACGQMVRVAAGIDQRTYRTSMRYPNYEHEILGDMFLIGITGLVEAQLEIATKVFNISWPNECLSRLGCGLAANVTTRIGLAADYEVGVVSSIYAWLEYMEAVPSTISVTRGSALGNLAASYRDYIHQDYDATFSLEDTFTTGFWVSLLKARIPMLHPAVIGELDLFVSTLQRSALKLNQCLLNRNVSTVQWVVPDDAENEHVRVPMDIADKFPEADRWMLSGQRILDRMMWKEYEMTKRHDDIQSASHPVASLPWLSPVWYQGGTCVDPGTFRVTKTDNRGPRLFLPYLEFTFHHMSIRLEFEDMVSRPRFEGEPSTMKPVPWFNVRTRNRTYTSNNDKAASFCYVNCEYA